ncbi:MAG: glycosyltransferase family 2 protein [Phycisphaeraceae bacterium]
MGSIDYFLLVLCLGLSVPIIVFSIECLLAWWPPRQWRRVEEAPPERPRLAVLMPAHNEAAVIAQTIRCVLGQLGSHDRLLVVADNCDDETAQLARQMGADVRERRHSERRGKGYALDYGLCCLAEDPPEVVVMLDADCQISPGTLDRLAYDAMTTGRPVQGLYMMEKPAAPSPRDLVSALAVLIKNRVRPLGLRRAGLPCLLTGSGMAFPWRIIRSTPVGSGNLVEDMQLGLDLLLVDAGPRFCPGALITGRLPADRRAAATQRTRWEQGHLSTLLGQAPRLLGAGFRQRRPDLLVMALDLAVPPLSLLVACWLLIALLVSAAAATGNATWWPAGIVGVGGLLFGTAVVGSWMRFAIFQLPLWCLLAVPFYVLWKVPMYFGFLLHPQRKWIRTARLTADPSA